MRGEDSIDQAHALDEVCAEKLGTLGVGVDVERQHDAVYLVLHACMLGRDLNLLVLIERHTEHLEHNLIQRRRLPFG